MESRCFPTRVDSVPYHSVGCIVKQYLNDGVSVLSGHSFQPTHVFLAEASGYPTKNVQWRRIEAAPQDFVQPDALPEGMGIMEADKYSKGNLEKLLIFFRRHQAGEVPWEKGLVFIPYGDRTELHYQRRSNNSNSGEHVP